MMTDTNLATIAFETHNSRILNAPRQQVFDAFAKPDLLAQWWGPKGFSITIEKFDFVVGGEWVFTMQGPAGQSLPNRKKFVEIIRPGKIVFRHFQVGHDFLMSMTFEAIGDTTRLTWDMQFESDGDNPDLKGFILTANEENFDQLGDVLLQPTQSEI